MNLIKLPTGKARVRHDKRTLSFRDYRKGLSLSVPSKFGHQNLIGEWKMLGNDKYGDCVFAGAAHEHMLWAAEGGRIARFTENNVLRDYSAVTGFRKVDPNSDNGTVVLDALNYRRKTGVVDSRGKRHRLQGFTKLRLGDLQELKEAIYIFSGIGVGIEFPESAMEQFNEMKPWTVVKGARIDGGHYTPYCAYDADWLYCVTWARIQPVSYQFYKTYADEAYALLSPDMILHTGKTLEGFDLPALLSDIASL